MSWSAARSAVLLSFAVGLVTGCQGSPDEAEVGQSTQALSGVHRVQASGAAAEQLLARGGRLIADYGSYALLDVDGARLAGLRQDAFILRDEYRHVLLNAGTIDALDASSQRLRETTLPASGRQLHLVQFAGAVKPEWHAALQSSGVRIVAYIPHNAYLVWGDSTSLSRVLTYAKSAREVQWDGPYLNDYKLNPRAYAAAQPDGWQVQLVEDAEINADTLAKVAAIEQGQQVEQRALGYVNLVVHADREAALSLARQPDVVSIFPFYLPKKLDERANMIAAGQMTGNGPSGPGYLAWLTARGFTQAQFDASGFGVDVSDSGLDNATLLPNHYALYTGGNVNGASRVAYARLEGFPNGGSTIQGCDGHGTINAHIIGGFSTLTGGPHSDAQGFRYNLGIAPFVKVGSSVIFDPDTYTFPDFEDLQSRAYRDGMRVSSNSWGAAVGGAYNSDSQRYDALVRDAQPTASAVPAAGNQEMVIVFAAGNSGSSTNTVGSPATAKNVITAGAAENVHPFGGADFCGIDDTGADSANDIIFFSSRGPTDDGRIKPDLVAAGTHVSGGVAQASGQRAEPPANLNGQALGCFSAGGVCGGPSINFWPAGQQWTTASSGTSHSTPLIAGAAALVRQHLINASGAPPSPAMVKALLMNGTRYMTGSGANDNLYSNNQGMGHLDLGMTLDTTARTLRDQLAADLFTASGQTRTFNIFISDPAKPFRVTLAWTDAPGSTTGNNFNNNLDLTVTIGANTYRGNVFTGRNSVTGGTADIRNNVESVFLPAGVTGTATVTVTATNIVSDGVPGNASALDQDFALVIYNVCAAQPGAPTGATASVPGLNQIQLDWTPPATGNVVEYRIYRGLTAGGPYTQVGTAPNTATTFTDSTVSGGTTYFYVVRALDCAESASSNEVSATATGDCRIPPGFAGLTSADSAQASTCGINLSWSAATPNCGGPITYNVYRSRTAGFSPSTATRIASGVTGASYTDTANLSEANMYHYVVRAVETSGSSTTEEGNSVQRSVRPTGPITPGVSYFDNLDGTRPPSADAYWIPSGISLTQLTRTACHWQSSSTAWRFGSTGAAICPGSYGNSADARLVLGGNGSTPGINGFAFPAGTTGTMSFRHGWDMESGWDGVTLEYSTTGPTGPWTKVTATVSATAPYITAGNYNGSTGTLGSCWSGIVGLANGSFSTTTVNVNALAGRTAWFAWHYNSDSIIVREGHYLDDVSINTSAIASCTPGATPPGAAAYYAVTLPVSAQAGTAVTANLQAWDATEQVATGYNGTATLASSDAQAVLPASVTFSGGVAAPSVAFGTVGLQTLTASDSTDSTITGMAGTMVTPGAPAGLQFSAQPGDAVAGVTIAPAVRVQVVDQFGNAVPTATDSITLAIGANPSGGALNGTLTVSAVGGIATFSDLHIQQAGTGYTLVASSGTLTSATSDAFNITADVAADVRFGQQPTDSVAGVPFNPTVTVEIIDQYGNVNTDGSWGVFVTLENNPTGTFLMGNSFVNSINGVASFPDIAVPTVGTGYTLTALNAIGSATSGSFSITPNVPHHLTITQQPTDTPVNTPISSVVVTVRDLYENLATQSFAPISATLFGGTAGAQLLGTTTVFANAGVASFDDLAVDRTGPAYTLLFGSTGLYSAGTVGFDVLPGPPPVAVRFVTQPSDSTAGAAISPAITVRLVDGSGRTVIDASGAVTLAIGNNAGGGTLSGTLSATPVNGVATFSNASIDRAGTGYTLVASSAGLTSATSNAFNVIAASGRQLVFGVQPSNSTAGQTIAPAVAVEARDALGNLDTAFSGPVTVALNGGSAGATLSGTLTVNASGGVATFADLSVNRAGAGYSLSASSGSLSSATSGAFGVSAASAARLVFGTQPSNGVAGQAIAAVTVQAQDIFGNQDTAFTGSVTVALGGGNPSATLSGTLSANASGGVATFSDLSIDLAASGYTLTASSGALTPAASGAFAVRAGAATRLVFGAQPSNAVAGRAIAPAVTVEARDAFGNLDTAFTGLVTVALNGGNPSATLSGTTTVAASGGLAPFSNLSVDKVGSGYTLSASSGSLAGSTSGAFSVTAAGGRQLAFSAQPSNGVAGQAIAPAVTVEVHDAFGNLDTAFSGPVTVALRSGNPNATLSGTTVANASGGVATFADLSIDRAGAGYSLAASSGALAQASSGTFSVSAAAAGRLVFGAPPGNGVAGQAIAAVTVQAHDAFGNLDTTFTGAVTVALGGGDSAATLSGTTTVSASGGVATLSDLSIDRAASGYNLSANSGAVSPATSGTFTVRAGAATQLVFGGQPSSSVAGRAIAPAVTVEARDAFGNLDTAFNGLVTVALGGGNPAAALSGTITASASGGVAPFSTLAVDRVGSGYTLSANSGALAGATSGAFNVTAAAGRQLAFGVQPSSAAAGQAIAPAVTVEVHDAFGNLDTTFSGSVTVALGGGNPNATLSGTTIATASGGVATFSDLSVNRSGRGYTLAASAGGVTGGNSSPFNVSAGPPAKYVIGGVGLSVTASVEVAFSVQALDAQDNLATDYAGTAQLTSDDSAAVLPANVTFASGVAHNVRVTFKSTGVHSLTVTDTSTASLSASANLVVTNFPQPRVSITAPNNGASVTGMVTITAEASVATGTTLTRLEIFVDGTSVANGDTSTLSATWDVAELKKDTTHLIHAVVTDAAGNVVQSTPLTVIIGAQGCGCSTGAGGADLALLAAVGAALRAIAIRRRRAK